MSVGLRSSRQQRLLRTVASLTLILNLGDEFLLALLHLDETQGHIGHLLLWRQSRRHLCLPRGRGRRHGMSRPQNRRGPSVPQTLCYHPRTENNPNYANDCSNQLILS